MFDAIFPISIVVLGCLAQVFAFMRGAGHGGEAKKGRRGALFLLCAGAVLVCAFALWEHDVVLFFAQLIVALILVYIIRFRGVC